MKIIVTRYWYTQESTCGIMRVYTDATIQMPLGSPTLIATALRDAFECYTLEPPLKMNDKQAKPYCIPAATYQATKYMSPHFNMQVISILNVPDFTNVEVHPGNDPGDTDGCIVVGSTHSLDFVSSSKTTFATLMSFIPDGNFEFDILNGPKTEEPQQLSTENIKTIFDKPKGSPVSMKS